MSWAYYLHPEKNPARDDQPAGDVLHANLVGTLIMQGPSKYDPKILTDEVRSEIATVWELMPADKLIENHLEDIAYTLDEVLTDEMGYTNGDRYLIAEELVRYIRLMLEKPAPAPPPAATAVPAAVATAGNDAAEKAALAQLLAMAEDELVITGNISSTRQRICKSIRAAGNIGGITEVICLQGGSVSANIGKVLLLCPHGIKVRVSGNIGKVKITYGTNVELLKIAQGYAL